MTHDANTPNHRILIVDDSQTVQHDFKAILSPATAYASLAPAEVELFGEPHAHITDLAYELDTAQQGEEAVEKVSAAAQEGRPYALAFVDVRMPPGIDGIDAAEKMFKIDSRLHVVLCTAYSDQSWKAIIDRLGQTDRLLILKKPFDGIEVRQLALALTTKWQHHLLEDQKRDEMQQWLDELTQMVGNAKGEPAAMPIGAK